jgi:hypothetical protein
MHLAQVYQAARGLADHGHRLPPEERAAWRAVAMRLQECAEQEATWLAGSPPAGYAEEVRALHRQLLAMDTSPTAHTPPTMLAARWVAGWLAPDADRGGRAAPAPATAAQEPGRPGSLPDLEGHRRRRQAGLQPHPGWALLLISDASLRPAQGRGAGDVLVIHHAGEVPPEVEAVHCLAAFTAAFELTCRADGRSWRWRQVGYQFPAHIGPPPAPELPSAGEFAADLEHLPKGLIPGPIRAPGWWSVSSILGSSRPWP